MTGQVSLTFSARCTSIEGQGFSCMICEDAEAVGHVLVTGGPHDGRCLALLCPRHSCEDGYGEFKDQLVRWMLAGLLAQDLGPGTAGVPEVLHMLPGGEWHRDPLPEHRHDGAA